MARNAEESTLLRLPAEVRNRIYDFALGGMDIHIDYSRHWLHHGICKIALAGENTTTIRSIPHVQVAALAFAGAHMSCFSTMYIHSPAPTVIHKISLSLLAVCKQVHTEATLLPYTLNTFMFKERRDLSEFLKRLELHQRHALQSISVCAAKPQNYWPSDWELEYKKVAVKVRAPQLLPGLGSMVLEVEANHWEWGNVHREEGLRRFLEAAAKYWAPVSLSVATVDFYTLVDRYVK